MANGGSGGGDVFDVRKVRRLVELMKEYELSEVDLQQADHRIRLKRGSEAVIAPAPVVPSPAPAAQPAAPPPQAAMPAATAGDETADEANVTYITSPMVGTFYTAASPDAPAFVNVGDQVAADTPVCILEAMKVFNEIPAECTGTIAARLVENGDAIEFGQKLFKVKTN